MKVLAIDTATLMASVAIAEAGADDNGAAKSPAATRSPIRVLAWHESDVDTHSDRLLPLIAAVLSEASLAVDEVDAIAVGAGPGSFTGLRIGMATAKGLAFAAGKPLWTVSSLAALAMDFACPPGATGRPPDTGHPLLVPVLDARRQEVFAGFFRLSGDARRPRLEAVAEERVLAPKALVSAVSELAQGPAALGPAVLFGDAVTAYRRDLAAAGTADERARRTPSAVSVARLALSGESLPDMLLTGAPVYIRPSEAEIKFPEGNPGGTFSSRK